MKVAGFRGPLGTACNVVKIVVYVLREVRSVSKFGVIGQKFGVFSIIEIL